MESFTVSEALQLTLNTSAYQKKLLVCLSLALYSFSSYVFAVPFLLCDDPASSNITNSFVLINKDFPIRAFIRNSCYLMVPVGSFFFSYLSDLLGRQTMIKYLLMWSIVFRVFAAISLTTNVLILCSFFLGSFSLAGSVSCFLYIIESAPNIRKSFFTGVLMISVYLSLLFTCIMFVLRWNWRLVIGLDIALTSAALGLLNRCFESVEWTFFYHGSLKTETILTKIAGENNVLDQTIELDDNPSLKFIKVGLNSRFLLLFADWMSFGLFFCLTLQKTLEDLYLDKLVFALISIISLGTLLLAPAAVLRISDFLMIVSRISLIGLLLNLFPEQLWHLMHFVMPFEFCLLLTRMEELSVKKRAFLQSSLILFSFLVSQIVSIQVSRHPLTLLPVFLLLGMCSLMIKLSIN